MKNKMYNIIFPIYMLWLLPPIFIIYAILNYIIDSTVLLIISKILKIKEIANLYVKAIFKMWILGFIADFIGALFLFIISQVLYKLEIPIRYNIDYNPFGNFYAFVLVLIGIFFAGFLIYWFDKYIALKKVLLSNKEKTIIALFMAVLTAPYLFLLPQ